jgi:hypothetical protein
MLDSVRDSEVTRTSLVVHPHVGGEYQERG